MTCTTASGLLPAGIAVYVQRRAERSSSGNTIFGWAVRLYVSKRKTRTKSITASLGKWTFCDESRTSDFLAPVRTAKSSPILKVSESETA